MFLNKIKRCLLLVMALAAMLSLLTFQIFAAESDTQAEIDRILNDYLGTTTMSPEDISATVAEMDWETYQTARWEISELENTLVASMERGELTEAEAQQLIDRNTVLCNFSDALEEKNASDNEVSLFTTVNVLDGAVSVTDTANSNTVSDGVVTITAKGSLFSKKTNNITIKNNTANKAKLSFAYSASTYDSFTIDGNSADASGTYSVVLDPGNSVALVLVSNSGLSNTTATLTLSNFSLTVAADSSTVTFNYDSAYGSITVDGAAVASGASQDVTLADGAVLVATVSNGGRFLGWINGADNSILSTAASYTLNPASDMTVKAVFVGANSKPYFGVGATTQKSVSSGLLGMTKLYYHTVSVTYLFDDLNAATDYASSSTTKAVVLMNSATLPAGDYTIPAGVTLLIPFDDANSLYTTQALSSGTYTKPTAYRTLTLADGVNLTINGAMSLSAKHRYAQASKEGGAPTGAVSFVRMRGNSNITVNNGGALYAYGFITGSGSVTANSGATVYEMFQFTDFRGGNQSTSMKNGVFPLSQYYVQNIEVPLTLYSGAKEYAYTTIYMSSADFATSVAFIADSNAMFNLKSGNVVKKYDGATDRLIVEANGTMTLSSISLSLGTSSISSKDYELPINNNITVRVNSGNITINQDIALLPGAEVIVEKGATCTLGSGYSIYIYDADQWGTFCGSVNKKFIPVPYAPGKTYTRTEADLVDASILVNGTVDASAGYAYTTAGGANIYSTGSGVVKTTAGTETVTYQLVQNTGNTAIPITPVKLKNANDSYKETSGATSATEYTYYSALGEWHTTACGGQYTETVKTAAACETPGVKTLDCSCGYSKEEAIPATGHTEVIDAAVAATCTETGRTEGKHCSVCNEVLVAQEVVAALGHTEVVDEAVAPTCTETGLTEGKHCSVCNEVLVAQTVVDALGHTEVTDAMVLPTFDATGLTAGSHCSVCGNVITAQEEIPVLSGMSVNIAVNDSLDIHFYLTDDVIKDIQGYYPNAAISATITRYWLDGENKGKSEELAFTYEDGKWTGGADSDRFSYTNIAAKEMTDTMTVVISAGDKVLKRLENYSVKAYAMKVLQNTSGQSELTTALVDMLNYGAAAQSHFGYNQSTLANADLTEAQQGYATKSVTPKDTYSSESQAAAASVSAKNNLMYTFYFDLSGYTEEQRSGATAAISYSHYTGSDVSENVVFESFYKFNDRLYGVDVTGMYIADGRQPIACELSIGDDTLTATDSIEGYIARATSGNDVYMMLMKFIDSAYKYFS